MGAELIWVAVIAAFPPTLTILLTEWGRSKRRRQDQRERDLKEAAEKVERDRKEGARDALLGEIKDDVNSNMTAARAEIAAGRVEILAGKEIIESLRAKAVAEVSAASAAEIVKIREQLDALPKPRRRT